MKREGRKQRVLMMADNPILPFFLPCLSYIMRQILLIARHGHLRVTVTVQILEQWMKARGRATRPAYLLLDPLYSNTAHNSTKQRRHELREHSRHAKSKQTAKKGFEVQYNRITTLQKISTARCTLAGILPNLHILIYPLPIYTIIRERKSAFQLYRGKHPFLPLSPSSPHQLGRLQLTAIHSRGRFPPRESASRGQIERLRAAQVRASPSDWYTHARCARCVWSSPCRCNRGGEDGRAACASTISLFSPRASGFASTRLAVLVDHHAGTIQGATARCAWLGEPRHTPHPPQGVIIRHVWDPRI